MEERGTSEMEGGGLLASEETEGCGIGVEELDLRTWTDDGVEFEGEVGIFSRDNT